MGYYVENIKLTSDAEDALKDIATAAQLLHLSEATYLDFAETFNALERLKSSCELIDRRIKRESHGVKKTRSQAHTVSTNSATDLHEIQRFADMCAKVDNQDLRQNDPTEVLQETLAQYKEAIKSLHIELEEAGVYDLVPEEVEHELASAGCVEVGPMPHSALTLLAERTLAEQQKQRIIECDLIEAYGYPTFPSDPAKAREELELLRRECKMLEDHMEAALSSDPNNENNFR